MPGVDSRLGFRPGELVERAESFALWRHPLLLGMGVWGRVDDAVSDAWRDCLRRTMKKNGCPRFFAMDISESEPENSLASRVRTAAFIRETALNLDAAVVFTHMNAGPLVVARTLLRVAGTPQVMLCTQDANFKRCLEQMRQGLKPLPATVVGP